MIVILTAAVVPNAAGPVVVSDWRERLSEYVQATRQWSHACISRGDDLLVAEVSGFGATKLIRKAEVEATAFDFEATALQLRSGKGAVEAAALDSVVDSLDSPASLVKVTGRLGVSNAEKVLTGLAASSSIFMRMHYGRPWADSRMFAMPSEAWRASFWGLADEIDDATGTYLERTMGRRALICLANGTAICPLPVRPLWTGRSGSTGQRYDSFHQRLTVPLMGRAERAAHRMLGRKQL